MTPHRPLLAKRRPPLDGGPAAASRRGPAARLRGLTLLWACAGCVAATAQEAGVPPAPGSGSGAAPYSSAAHDALITARRNGQIAPAEVLAQLRAWLAQSPASAAPHARLASDAIVLAADQGRACDAAALGHAAGLDAVADYALAALVGAARQCADTALQGQAIQTWRQRMPQARAPLYQAAFWHLDTGDVEGARQLEQRLAKPAPVPTHERVSLLELQAALALAQQQRIQALGLYQQLLELAPDHAYARRQSVLLLAQSSGKAAAWPQAQRLQLARPGLFSALELATLEQGALGQRLGWAVTERDLRLGPQRLQPLDEVVAQLQDAQARHAAQAAQAPAEQRAAWDALLLQLQADQVLGEVERGRAPAAIAVYEHLARPGVQPPFHAQVAAARALARAGRSHDAVRLYERALAGADPADYAVWEARVGLVYAYADTARFNDAQALLDRLAAETPLFLRQAPQAQTPNPDYTLLQDTQGQLLLMGDQLQQAQALFERLQAAAGMNTGFRAGAATTALRRQRPEAALAQYRAVLADDPQSLHARASQADALMTAQEWRAARSVLASLTQDADDEGVVQRTAARYRQAVAPRLELDTARETGNLASADRVWLFEGRLSSALLDDAWRVHAGHARAQGRTDRGAQHHWQRTALGLGWTQGRWQVQAQLQQANAGPHRSSLGAAVDYRAGDRLRLAARYDGDSTQTPWRARAAGIGARALALEARWVHSESRELQLNVERLALSDGNRRHGAGLEWRERWIGGPRLQLESTLGAATGRYAQQERPYFSPAREHTVQAGVRAQWLTWREYERSFFQSVELSAGRYSQSGFGGGALWRLSYEHRWQLGPEAQLRYGASVGRHPYDGRHERQTRLYLQLSIPLS